MTDVMTHFLTSWRIFDVMTTYFFDVMTCFGRHDVLGRHDVFFDVMTCFGRHDELSDIMTYFGRHSTL